MSSDRAFGRQPVIITLIIALMINMAPVPEWADPFRPNWVALTLIYWAMCFPGSYSIGTAWLIGLIVDVALGTLLGQHALALSLTIYITVKFHLQMRQFPPLQLAATVFALLAFYQFILFWINGVAGITTSAVLYWGPVLSGTIVWFPLSMFLRALRFRAQG